MPNRPAPPFENHKMCCGTGCDKRKLEADFESMESKLKAIQQCLDYDCHFKAKVKHIEKIMKGDIL